MAGIGFRLREMAQRKTFIEWLKLYSYSAVIFSGPWLISILALAALSTFVVPSVLEHDVRLFVVIVVYIYCFSLIMTGFIQLVVTRYVSDEFYLRRPESVVPAFIGAVALTSICQTIIGAIALYFADLDLLNKVVALGLYVIVSIIWIEMLFLSASKDYAQVVMAFAVGYLASFIAGQVLGTIFGLEGLTIGFLVGQVTLSVLLMYRIFSEYRFGMGFNFKFLSYVRRYPSLVATGVLYNVAIWIDKVIYWYSPSGLHIHGYFYTHFPYDSAMFIAYVTVLPTIAIFLLRVETDFYLSYKNYYGAIIHKASYTQILERKRDMANVLISATKTAAIYQGATTSAVIVLMPYLISLLGLDPVLTPVFRVAAGGALFHGALAVLMILLLYFDFRGSALFTASVFFLSNGAFALLATTMGDSAMGYGYLAACLLSFGVGLGVFINRFKNLEYLTFMRQPIR